MVKSIAILCCMAKHNIQWHPLLGRLLRHRVEGYYELLTGVPVGDLPRQADIVLLRRTASAPLPFRGLWRHLTAWNVLEYKGPTVTARRQHLPLLVEVGLGISRRLNAQSVKQGLLPTPEEEVSFWYLANRLGPSFLRAAASWLGRLEVLENGVWTSSVLGHPCFLVSTAKLAVDKDSLPLHVLGVEPLEQQVAVGQFVMEAVDRFDTYGTTFAALHPAAWKEVIAMAKTRQGGPDFDLSVFVETMGWEKVIKSLGKKELIENLGKKELIKQLGIDDILANLTPTERRELQRRLGRAKE